ncbi:hypothetical protein AYJ08_00975 [Brevibacillus sp. SKDU10]|uniref:hypothetical protein n=1 Tax=Brevibacillus sp. SKDU10 TaxID=1247872 RepID=UPI0007C99118|nr:hypothetical protein [Brevibacillus sp. SKDU10]OAJ73373.1 hypothetical protein AYJ08_00975 [Brevibacillus sp. SKDU10]
MVNGRIFQFSGLLNRFTTTFEVEVKTKGDYDDTGRWMEGTEKNEQRTGAIVPMPMRIVMEQGGRFTLSDHLLYCLDPIELHSEVTYAGNSYRVEEPTDFTAYADCYRYVLKRVSPFD